MNVSFFFFNDTATTEIYTLSLHDALPISQHDGPAMGLQLEHILPCIRSRRGKEKRDAVVNGLAPRSEEHTSELQSQSNLVCRLLLEKKKFLRDCSKSRNRPSQFGMRRAYH